ncbi:hypothetical protein ABZP36_018631 [Zizania latifolia]
MAPAARPSARRSPNPSPAAAAAAAARLRDAPPRAAHVIDTLPVARRTRDTNCRTCGDIIDSGNVKRCQCKKTPEHVKNGVHHNNDMPKEKGSSRPNSSNKYRTHKSSGGTYSKPDARVKIIPAEEIAYVWHGKQYGKTVGSAGLQKRHCRRSVTPPPSSRKVSLVKSTMVTQEPKQPVSPVISCISPMRPKTAENGYSLVGGYTINSFTTQIASTLKRPSPICSAVLSQPSGTSLITDAISPKNLSRPYRREAFVKKCSSRASHCQGQSSAIPPAGLLKEAVINPLSSKSVHLLGAHSTAVPPGTKAEPSSKSVCAPCNEKSSPVSCNLGTLQCQGRIIAVSPAVQKRLTTEPVSLSPKSVPSEKSTEAYPNAKSRPSSSPDLFDAKCKVGSWQCETIIPPTKSLPSTSLAQCVELSNDFEAVPSTKGSISSEKQTNQEAPINCNVTLGTPVILHTKLHKKHYQPDACWKITGICLSHYMFPVTCAGFIFQNSEMLEVDLKFDMLIDEIGIILSLDASPGFTKAKCLPRTGETAGSYIDSSPILSLDTPPGFPLDVPPGFTEAHRLPTLSLDTPPGFSLEVPPGFTEADRLPSGYENDVFEKKPLIDFTLNAPRLVQTEVFPGFTKLLAVKQEPGLPTIYNTTEKVASIGKGNETNIKHSKVSFRYSGLFRFFKRERKYFTQAYTYKLH